MLTCPWPSAKGRVSTFGSFGNGEFPILSEMHHFKWYSLFLHPAPDRFFVGASDNAGPLSSFASRPRAGMKAPFLGGATERVSPGRTLPAFSIWRDALSGFRRTPFCLQPVDRRLLALRHPRTLGTEERTRSTCGRSSEKEAGPLERPRTSPAAHISSKVPEAPLFRSKSFSWTLTIRRAKLLSYSKWAGVAMGQTSRIVTIVDGVEVMEVTVHDPEGNPLETSYHVRGERYETLRQAMEAAKGIGE